MSMSNEEMISVIEADTNARIIQERRLDHREVDPSWMPKILGFDFIKKEYRAKPREWWLLSCEHISPSAFGIFSSWNHAHSSTECTAQSEIIHVREVPPEEQISK